MVSQIIDKLDIDTLLDYGCGSNLSLMETLKPERDFTYQAYDPGVSRFAQDPSPAEFVVCIDVLEHIEPQYLQQVLDHLESLSQVALFASVHTGPAGKHLEDGRNAHLTQQPPEWWLPHFWDRFQIQTFQVVSPVEFFIIAHNAGLELDA